MFSIISKAKNMQFMAQGATAGVSGCQTLGQVSKQMDSLLDRQSSQRILPDESCLLAKRAEFSVIRGSSSLAATL